LRCYNEKEVFLDAWIQEVILSFFEETAETFVFLVGSSLESAISEKARQRARKGVIRFEFKRGGFCVNY
jgi:hypothetical protein